MSKSKRFVEPTLPKSATASFAVIKEILNRGWIPIPADKAFNGSGAPGDFLEHLFGGKKNNKDSPDLNDWEVKFHGGVSLLTLFHKEPSPRGISRFLVNEYGWPDDNGQTSFRHTIGGESKRGFYVKNELDRIVVRHNTIDGPVPMWKHNTILNACSKMRRLILVEGEMQNHPVRQVNYKSATAFWDFNITGFCDACEKGLVKIDFDARTTKGPGTALRNHGTKFRIKIKDLSHLYGFSQKITLR